MGDPADMDQAQLTEKLAELAVIVRIWRSSFPAAQFSIAVDTLREMLRQVKATAHPWPTLLEPVYHRVEYILEHTALAQQGTVEEKALPAWWADLITQADTAAEHIKRLQASLSED